MEEHLVFLLDSLHNTAALNITNPILIADINDSYEISVGINPQLNDTLYKEINVTIPINGSGYYTIWKCNPPWWDWDTLSCGYDPASNMTANWTVVETIFIPEGYNMTYYNITLQPGDPQIIIQPGAATGKDSWIELQGVNTNHGTDTILNQGTPFFGDDRSLYEFNVSIVPSNAQNISANFTVRSNQGAPATISVFRLTESWTELGVTWNSRDGITNWGTIG